MDLNYELMREQIALYGIRYAGSRATRNFHRGSAETIRARIDCHFGRGAFRPVAA